jgi:hypothetical protein
MSCGLSDKVEESDKRRANVLRDKRRANVCGLSDKAEGGERMSCGLSDKAEESDKQSILL